MLATVIGEVTEGDRLTVDWHGERIIDVPPRTVAHEGPVYERPMARPRDLDALQADDAARLPRPTTPEELHAHWLAVLSSPDGADKTWVTEQYDRYVRGNTVLAQPEDAGQDIERGDDLGQQPGMAVGDTGDEQAESHGVRVGGDEPE